ncbi:BglG family transcription antiterminator [Anaerotruncus rubiinfantis]|jgi:mannitol operon transcriptional antiterminator|nr:PTS sugar transporter subunit IIA [Anaerotruncus rubiinfantis]
MLYKRCIETIEQLIDSEKPITIAELARDRSVSARTVRNDLEIIDEWLAGFGHAPITRVPSVGVFLGDADGMVRMRLKTGNANNYIMSSQERVRVIIGMLLTGETKTSITAIAEKLQVSGATISNDIQKVKKWMDDYGIRMVSKPHMGILMQDSERNIRRGCVMLLREVLDTGTRQQELIGAHFMQAQAAFNHYRMDAFSEAVSLWREEILKIIAQLQESDGVSISDNGFCAMFLYLLINFVRVRQGFSLQFTPQERRMIYGKSGIDYKRIRCFIKMHTGLELDENEMLQINVEWMSLRKFGASPNVNVDNVLISKELIEAVKTGLDLEFEADENTILELATHLSVMSYRLILNVPAENNPVLNEIEAAFPDVCAVVREKLQEVMQNKMGPVSDSVCDREAVYIAMHIIACIHKNTKSEEMKKDVIIVCGNTIATSKILENRLKALFSNVNVVRTISYNEFVNAASPLDCDLIISTLPLESTHYQCVTVNPLLKLEDINKLMNVFMLRMQNVDMNKYIGATINIASRSLKLSPEEKIKLSIELTRDIETEMQDLSRKRSPTLGTLLTADLVRTGVPARNCYEAIQIGGDLLRRAGLITQEHIDRMIQLKKKLGGYIVIDQGVAMPHLLVPELEGPCMSLITLEKPVRFHNAENDPVDLVIVLLSNNNTSHIKVLEELIEILNQPEKKQAIRRAENPYELLGLL